MTTAIHTEHPHVVRTDGIVGGRPRIAGTRVWIEFIARFVQSGVTAPEILEMLARKYNFEIAQDGRVVSTKT